MKRRQRYLRTDECIDTLSSLAKAAETAALVESDLLQWKWLLIAIHSSVQGSVVLALSQGSSLLTLKSSHAKNWLKAHETGGPWPSKLDLDYFLELYEKVKAHAFPCPSSGAAFAAESRHDRAMKQLNDLRNGFVHFSPKGWSIELAGLPRICLTALEVLDYLLWRCERVKWPSRSTALRGKREYNRLGRSLQALEDCYVSERSGR